MKSRKIITWIWHAFFYIFAPPPLRRYALTCKETVTELNINNESSRRVKLHLSLCQGCSNYLKYSHWLRTAFSKKKQSSTEELSRKIFDRIK